jgi:hypothetical protein
LDEHLHADAGEEEGAPAGAGPGLGDADPAGGVVLGVAIPVEADGDSSVLVGVDLLAFGADHDRGVRAVCAGWCGWLGGAVGDCVGDAGEAVGVAGELGVGGEAVDVGDLAVVFDAEQEVAAVAVGVGVAVEGEAQAGAEVDEVAAAVAAAGRW